MEEETDDVYLDLSLDLISQEQARSVAGVVAIPLFTGEFTLPERTPRVNFNDVFTLNEISRGQTEVIEQAMLFQEPIIMRSTATVIDEEGTHTLALILSFVLVGLVTMLIMSLYLKKRKKKVMKR